VVNDEIILSASFAADINTTRIDENTLYYSNSSSDYAYRQESDWLVSGANRVYLRSVESFYDEPIMHLLGDHPIKNAQVWFDDYKKTKQGVLVYGIHNKISQNNLKEGVYGFSKSTSHSRNYFLIYENKKIIILDVTSLESLSNSIQIFLEFADRKNYCVELINDYINRFTNSYFVINKYPSLREDRNCVIGIKSTIDLP